MDYDKDERNQMADTYTVERKIRIDAPAPADKLAELIDELEQADAAR